MTLITTYEQANNLKQGDNLRKQFEDEITDYQVNANNRIGTNVDLLHLPLLVPDIAVINGEVIENTDGAIKGNFPINRTYKELVDGTWYIL